VFENSSSIEIKRKRGRPKNSAKPSIAEELSIKSIGTDSLKLINDLKVKSEESSLGMKRKTRGQNPKYDNSIFENLDMHQSKRKKIPH
jgi:hypothetical protein